MRRLRLFMAGLAMLHPAVVSAVPIELLRDDRSVFASYVGQTVVSVPATPFQAVWNGGFFDALTTAEIHPDRLFASMEVTLWSETPMFGPSYQYGHVVHDITFGVSEPQDVRLWLSFVYGSSDTAWMELEGALYQDDDPVLGMPPFDPISLGPDGQGSFAYEATLSPGIYRLVVAIRSDESPPVSGMHRISTYGFYELEFVPEPGTAVLLALGLAVLAASRRGA